MITGAHSIIYSTNAEADRNFLRDVLDLPHVDVGGGWLIFGLPPAEVAFHPAESNDKHELFLLCDDVTGVVRMLEARGVACSPVQEERWGSLIHVTLPGGGRIGVYQPKHPRAPAIGAPAPAAAPRRPRRKPKTAKKAAPKKGRGAGRSEKTTKRTTKKTTKKVKAKAPKKGGPKKKAGRRR